MKMLKTAALALALGVAATSAQAANIVQTAAGAGQFNTLLAAAKAAGLVPALSGHTKLTVFAPTDEAFAALPAGTVESLLKPENKDKLAGILKYHVVAGEVMAADIPLGFSVVPTLKETGDKTLVTTKFGSTVKVDLATVVTADIKTSNGVIHVIDRVMLPSF
jgi:uncharacterized surface protein with fasciclin (FAS1) repeats